MIKNPVKKLSSLVGLDKPIIPVKAKLIDHAIKKFNIQSMVDLGACWGVNGGYTFHALDNHRIEKAVIVDGNITQLTQDKAKDYEQLEFIQGALGGKEVIDQVGKVDAAIMFDILLHQVSPNWDEFLAAYSKNINTLIIYNQNWVHDQTIRFIDLGVEQYVQRVYHTNEEKTREWFAKHDEYNAAQKKPWRDVHNFWQWGIADHDLIDTLHRLGYRLNFFANYGLFHKKFSEIEVVGLVCHKNS